MPTVTVSGIPRANLLHIVGTYKAGQAPVGYIGVLLFGTVGYRVASSMTGLASEQQFGVPSCRGGPITIFPPVPGVPSAQQFGTVTAYAIWLNPPGPPAEDTLTAIDCDPVTLAPVACDDLVLTPSVSE